MSVRLPTRSGLQLAMYCGWLPRTPETQAFSLPARPAANLVGVQFDHTEPSRADVPLVDPGFLPVGAVVAGIGPRGGGAVSSSHIHL